jgi:hypothetical protein
VCVVEEQEASLAALRAVLIEGEDSGPTAFDFDDFIVRKRKTEPPSL